MNRLKDFLHPSGSAPLEWPKIKPWMLPPIPGVGPVLIHIFPDE